MPIFEVVNIIVDVQPFYTRQLAGSEATDLPARVNAHAMKLRDIGIPSVRLGFAPYPAMYNPLMYWSPIPPTLRANDQYNTFGEWGPFGQNCKLIKMRSRIEEKLGAIDNENDLKTLLVPIGARTDEPIIFKDGLSPLDNPYLGNLLDAWQTRTAIIMGVQATACVTATTKGLIQADKKCVLALDCLGDSQFSPSQTRDHRYIQAVMQRFLGDHADNASYVLAQDLTGNSSPSQKNPAAALQQPPDRKDRNRSATFAAPGF